MTIYAKTNHMSGKMFLRFLAAIAKVLPDEPLLQFGVDCSLPARDIAFFICAILKTNTVFS